MAPQPIETFHYGQGEVLAARRTSAAEPPPNAWKKLWDVSALSLALAPTAFTHKESRTGGKYDVREIETGRSGTCTATLRAINTHNLALLMWAEESIQGGGTVTDEPFPSDTAAGDIVMLDYLGIEDLEITDSAGSPVTIAPTHYDSSSLVYGTLPILTLPTSPAPTPPLLASFTHAGARQVGILATKKPEIALRYNGINLAEDGAPVVLDLWRMSTGALSELALINNGEEVAGMPFTGTLLADLTKPAGPLGYFGRIAYVGDGS